MLFFYNRGYPGIQILKLACCSDRTFQIIERSEYTKGVTRSHNRRRQHNEQNKMTKGQTTIQKYHTEN